MAPQPPGDLFVVIRTADDPRFECHGRKAFFYPGGLTEGTETIAAFVAFCLFPGTFAALAYGFGALCWVTTLSRMAAAGRSFGD